MARGAGCLCHRLCIASGDADDFDFDKNDDMNQAFCGINFEDCFHTDVSNKKTIAMTSLCM